MNNITQQQQPLAINHALLQSTASFCNMVAPRLCFNIDSNIKSTLLRDELSSEMLQFKTSQRMNKRTPVAGSVAAAWSSPLISLRATDFSEAGLKRHWDTFLATYGGKCSSVDAVSTITLPAISKTTMAKTGWFEDFFEAIKPRLESVHCMALVLGDEALEDFGPQPAAEPTYTVKQACCGSWWG
jgi:hypothetical protein